jgi:aspartyl-tRNA(Asn)/glutamyl-tRNA(Gln) amidotransferase subunit A
VPDIDVFAHDLAGWSAALAANEVTSVDLTLACLGRIDRHDATFKIMTTLTADDARRAAIESDQRRTAGQPRGVLEGIPVALKDNIDLAGTPATAGMASRAHLVSDTDAVVTARLRAAGAVILGKVNMHEAALGATNDNPLYGRTFNPHRPSHTPGGSSGGSGAAVAAGFCLAALGTDTLGSVRIPAAYCGVAGIKATRGLVSPRGVVPLSWTFDHVGPLAPSVRDLGLLLNVLAGFDRDCAESVAVPQTPQNYDPGDPKKLSGVRLGRLEGLDAAGIAPEIADGFGRAVALLGDLGAEIVPVRLDGHDYGRLRRAGLIISEVEGAVVHADDLANRADQLSDGFRAMLSFGASLPATRLVQAQRDFAAARVRVHKAFGDLDALIMPTALHTAFDFDDPVPDNQADLTALANLTDRPAVSVPMGLSPEGLPMGLQFLGLPFGESAILRFARTYELAAGHDMRPRALD